MNYNKKLLIQALAVVIFTILLYRTWGIFDAMVFYMELLCFTEILIQFAYLLFNRKKISVAERDKEIVAIFIYLIVMVAIYLYSIIVVK